MGFSNTILFNLINADLIRVIIHVCILTSLFLVIYITIYKRLIKKKIIIKLIVVLITQFSIIIIYFVPYSTEYCSWDIEFIRVTIDGYSVTLEESEAIYEVLELFDNNSQVRTLKDELAYIDDVPIMINIFGDDLLGHILIYDAELLLENGACEGYIVLPTDDINYLR